MDITFVGEYFPPELGGLEISTERIALWLGEHGHRVKVITGTDSLYRSTELRGPLRIHRLPRNGPSSFAHLASSVGLLDHSDFLYFYGIGEAPSSHWRPVLATCRAARGLKIGGPGQVAKLPNPRESLRAFDIVFCLNAEIVSEVIRAGVRPKKIACIRNGLDIDHWRQQLYSREAARALLAIPADAFVVGSVGRIVKTKGFPKLVEVFAETSSNDERFTLLLQLSPLRGESAEMDKLKRAITLTGTKVRLLSQSSVVSLAYAAMDVFVSLSEVEGAANVVLEAMASEVPVVATRIPGHSLFIRDGIDGFLVHRMDAVEAVRLTQLLRENNMLRKSITRKALERCKEFDIRLVGAEQEREILAAVQRKRDYQPGE